MNGKVTHTKTKPLHGPFCECKECTIEGYENQNRRLKAQIEVNEQYIKKLRDEP